jgi:hypothetical protein
MSVTPARVSDRIERQRSRFALKAFPDEEGVDHGRQFVDQPVIGGALHVIDDELQHGGFCHRQGQRLAISQREPGGPVAQRAAVTCERIGGLALAKQGLNGSIGERGEGFRFQRANAGIAAD